MDALPTLARRIKRYADVAPESSFLATWFARAWTPQGQAQKAEGGAHDQERAAPRPPEARFRLRVARRSRARSGWVEAEED